MGKNRCESNKTSAIWEKMGNPVPFEKVMGPNRHNMENYGDLQPIARSIKPTFWVPSENLSFGIFPKVLKLFRSLKIALTRTPLHASIEIAW